MKESATKRKPRTEQALIINKHVGNRITQLRKDNDYTIAQVSQLLGTSNQSYRKYESGKVQVTLETLLKICAVYKIQFSDVLPEIPVVELKENTKTIVTGLKGEFTFNH